MGDVIPCNALNWCNHRERERESQLVLWAQSATKDYIRADHKRHSIFKLFISQVNIPQVRFFWAYLYSAGAQHGNLHPTGWPILFCETTQEQVLTTANAWKNRERLWKKCRWMDWKGRNKEEIPDSRLTMHGNILTYFRLYRRNL